MRCRISRTMLQKRTHEQKLQTLMIFSQPNLPSRKRKEKKKVKIVIMKNSTLYIK